MTGTIERNANPRNLFLGISLVILCGGASISLGMSAARLALVLAGAGFSWLYSFLNFCDPYSHSDFIQNGNAAVVFITVYTLGTVGGINSLSVWIASFAALIAAELANTFITGSTRRDYPVMGILLSVMAVVCAAMIYMSNGNGSPADFAPALTGWAFRKPGPVLPAVMAAGLGAAGALIYKARSALFLSSHGRAYYNPAPREYNGMKAGLIVGKALALSISYSLVGVFGGVAYYLMTASKSRYSLAESMAAAVLFALVLSALSWHASAAAAVAASILASQMLFMRHKKINWRT